MATPPPAPNVAPPVHPLVNAAAHSPESIINDQIMKMTSGIRLMGRAAVQIGNTDAARFFGEALQSLLKAQQALNPNQPKGAEQLPPGPLEPVSTVARSAAPEGGQIPGA